MFWLFGVFFSNSLSLVVECFSCFQGLEGVTLFFEVWVWFFGGSDFLKYLTM